jgi:hypothetical protein
MKYHNIELSDWNNVHLGEWGRFQVKTIRPVVSIMKIYSATGVGFAWYPEFSYDFENLQKLYDNLTNWKEFPYDEEKLAMKYVDDFLLKINNLRAFI